MSSNKNDSTDLDGSIVGQSFPSVVGKVINPEPFNPKP